MIKKHRVLPLCAVTLLALILAARALDLPGHTTDLRNWIAELGVWGPAVFALLYATATVLAMPGAPLGILAGAMFGAFTGVISVLSGATLGAALCFLLARYLMRGFLVRKLSDNPKFQRLERLTEKHGTGIIAITRLLPLFPFNLLNYGFGLTNVGFGRYVFWSAVCMIPGTVMYVAGSNAVFSFLQDGAISFSTVLAVCASVAALFILAGIMRRRLKRDGGGHE